MPTPTRRLADHLLPGGVDHFVTKCRDLDMSWRQVALAMRDYTEGAIDVTGETVRNWAAATEPPHDQPRRND
jgi:hypothetical protein